MRHGRGMRGGSDAGVGDVRRTMRTAASGDDGRGDVMNRRGG